VDAGRGAHLADRAAGQPRGAAYAGAGDHTDLEFSWTWRQQRPGRAFCASIGADAGTDTGTGTGTDTGTDTGID
jgi:hypothetical protein